MGHTMTFDKRIHAIVRADRVTEINATLVVALGAEYDGALCVPLSATGQSPATHYGASSQETEATRQALLPLLDPANGVHAWPGQIPGDPVTENTVTDSNSLPLCAPSDMRWTWDACLQSLGLQRIRPVPPGF